jgi:hypothetical protein
LLSLSREEINKAEKAENSHFLGDTIPRKLLKGELDVINGLYPGGADYLLVDCRSPREYSSAALVFWADTIVSMFPASEDGLQGAATIHNFVRRARSGLTNDDIPPRIIPVLCRIPEDFSRTDEDAADMYARLLSCWKQLPTPPDLKIEPPEMFEKLHEFADLEQSERILLQPARPRSPRPIVRDVDRLLSHDYVRLFQRIFSGEKDRAKGMLLADAKIWNNVLGLRAGRAAGKSSFELLANGIMLNRDNERNVAIRAKAIMIWLTSFGESQKAEPKQRELGRADINRDTNNPFHNAGYAWGSDFGRELVKPGSVWEKVPKSVPDRLAGWCQFDHRAGFGRMTHTYVAANESGTIIWKDTFLEDKKEQRPYVRQFACGYIRGVLEHLLPNSIGRVSVRPTGTTTFNFTKSSSGKSGKKHTKKQPKMRYVEKS